MIESVMASDYTSEANGVRATESELMNSTLRMATMTVTETAFAAEVTATEDDDEDDDEDSIVETDSQTNIDRTESATAGLTERAPTKQVIAKEGPTNKDVDRERKQGGRCGSLQMALPVVGNT
jgi:hypothetical protein